MKKPSMGKRGVEEGDVRNANSCNGYRRRVDAVLKTGGLVRRDGGRGERVETLVPWHTHQQPERTTLHAGPSKQAAGVAGRANPSLRLKALAGLLGRL